MATQPNVEAGRHLKAEELTELLRPAEQVSALLAGHAAAAGHVRAPMFKVAQRADLMLDRLRGRT